MVIGALFQANLNADKIYIDLTYLPDPIKNKFWLKIQNQSLSTLYFKIVCNIPNWSLNTPADGKLGSVAGGAASGNLMVIIERSKPGSETTDTGSLKIEAYTDSGYTNKVGEDDLTVTAYIEDLENWTDVIKSDFDDGTAQGWTLDPAAYMSISNDESVEVGGYSARYSRAGTQGGPYDEDVEVSKSIALPNRNKVRASIFIAYRLYSNLPGYYVYFQWPRIFVDGIELLYAPYERVANNETITEGWLKLTVDLSAYKNQTKTVKFQCRAKNVTDKAAYVHIWFDRIVIAGKD